MMLMCNTCERKTAGGQLADTCDECGNSRADCLTLFDLVGYQWAGIGAEALALELQMEQRRRIESDRLCEQALTELGKAAVLPRDELSELRGRAADLVTTCDSILELD